MMYEVNQNCNDIMVVRQEDHQLKTNATTATNDGARLDEFLKVNIIFTNSYIGKMPEPARESYQKLLPQTSMFYV